MPCLFQPQLLLCCVRSALPMTGPGSFSRKLSRHAGPQVLGRDVMHDVSGMAARATAFEVFQKIRRQGPNHGPHSPQLTYEPLLVLATPASALHQPPIPHAVPPAIPASAGSLTACLHCCYIWLPDKPSMVASEDGWLVVSLTDARGTVLHTGVQRIPADPQARVFSQCTMTSACEVASTGLQASTPVWRMDSSASLSKIDVSSPELPPPPPPPLAP